MRRAGLGVAAALGVCLLAVAVAMAGGPQAPFTHWAAPNAPAAGTGATRHPAGARTGTPSPSASPRPHASASVPATGSTGLPLPTNPAGRTPSGQPKSPNPHKSSHGP